MLKGSLTGYIDVAQMTLYAFLFFFLGIVLYLRREDKREGYPLEVEYLSQNAEKKQGFPLVPKPKIFRLGHGGVVLAPSGKPDSRPILAQPLERWPGSPLQPTGDPMIDAVGPAAYAERQEVPEMMIDGRPMIVPMRDRADMSVDLEDSDPRGMVVIGADKKRAGVVSDLWIDLAEPQIRYLQVTVDAEAGTREVLLPMTFARISDNRREVKVKSILARHFATVPATKSLDQVTKREEDRICAYFGSGHLYAKPSRLGPIL
ncbi:photosynthetic reaction center subunit H [Lichenifustis flavocetrariae]|uniref:Photosynthetic reaction center subunit H n=1 Tax=Lichenifustis flavocetrariae TaxID=2949735 RepID=A0AA42CH82_9HYPH|nr:photosynthetic reaction center subunit H [Lichenifustis flavocetrariae]MCW6507308.1 photosynthetic reaction center subunit H [Lichenifustis flavocetrariae]